MEMPTENHDAVIAQLCVVLHCLPSQIDAEDYNGIENIIAVLNAQSRRQKKS